MNRFDEYKALCARINCLYKGRNTDFIDCPVCKQANLWTYWQGVTAAENLKNDKSPLILLIGQDWGYFNKETVTKSVEESFGNYRNAFQETINGSFTDRKLIDLFKLLGYDGIKKPTIDTQNSELFFSNLIPGYRKEKSISGFKQSWIDDEVAKIFKTLVCILKPKLILCLGRSIYEGVMYSLIEKKVSIKTSYNEFLNNQNYPSDVHIQTQEPIKTDYTVHVFALGHCGGMGTANRKRGKFKGNMEDDWKKIAAYL